MDVPGATEERAGCRDVTHASAAEASLGAEGERGRIIVKASRGEFVLAAVAAAYEVVAEGLFDVVRGFAEQVLGVLGAAFGEVSGSFVLAVEEVLFFLGEVATVGEGNVFPETRGTQLYVGSGSGRARASGGASWGGGAKGIGAGVSHGLGDRAFKRSGDLQELIGGVMISGQAVQDVVIMGDNAT
jgi:hypothetical protein